MKKEKSQWTLQKKKKAIREYYEQLYSNKFDNLEEMENFLDSQPELIEEEIDQLNRLNTKNEIAYVIKTLPINKSPGPDSFTGKFYQTYKEQHIKKVIHHSQEGFIPSSQGGLNICKSINIILHINKRKVKNHMIISTDAEKAFDKVQHPFMIKTLTKVGTEGTYLT